MTQLDTRLRSTAETLIARFGKAMTLRRETVGTYDAATATSAVTTVEHAVTGVPATPSRTLLETGTVQAGDTAVLLAAKALAVEPQAGDALIADAVTWRVMQTRATWSGEQVVVYELLLRS